MDVFALYSGTHIISSLLLNQPVMCFEGLLVMNTVKWSKNFFLHLCYLTLKNFYTELFYVHLQHSNGFNVHLGFKMTKDVIWFLLFGLLNLKRCAYFGF
jgi:hypothetical protein